MNYKLWIALYLIFATSIIYWDIQRHKDDRVVSACHYAEVKIIKDRTMCIECKMYCEVLNGKGKNSDK
jgi:hypothetical protein